MQPPTSKPPVKLDSDSLDVVAMNRSLSRKVTFWRRAAWLLLGGAAVFGAVIYSRGETRRRECRESLAHYSQVSLKVRLAEQHPEILEQQWNQFEQPPTCNSPIHYDLIVHNWIKSPRADESIPLAVCRDRHVTTLSVGRHVLMNTSGGHRIVWMNDDATLPVLREARKDNR